MRWARHIACTEAMRFACKISLLKPNLARPSRKPEDNTGMDFDKNSVILRYFIPVAF
jgi:hypothetical protein